MLSLGVGLLYVGGFAVGYVLGGPKTRRKPTPPPPPAANDNTPMRRIKIR